MTSDKDFRKWRKKRPYIDRDDIEKFEIVMNEMEKMIETLPTLMPEFLKNNENKKECAKCNLKDCEPMIFSFSIESTPEGVFEIQKLTKIKPLHKEVESPKQKPETYQPLSDILELDNEIRVVIELPGLNAENILLSPSENKIDISVGEKQNKYCQVLLPTKVDFNKMKSTYKNGVLQIILPKTK